MIPPRITFVVGPLAKPLEAWCEQQGATPSQAIRAALAKMLRVEVPQMPEGNPAIGEQATVGAAARWKKRKR